jgi:succinate-acetate transporter protein
MFLSGILEWVLGNTFPSTVFCSFGCFWFSFGGILSPSFGAYAFYAPADATSASAGLATPGFNASLGKISCVPVSVKDGSDD